MSSASLRDSEDGAISIIHGGAQEDITAKAATRTKDDFVEVHIGMRFIRLHFKMFQHLQNYLETFCTIPPECPKTMLYVYSLYRIVKSYYRMLICFFGLILASYVRSGHRENEYLLAKFPLSMTCTPVRLPEEAAHTQAQPPR